MLYEIYKIFTNKLSYLYLKSQYVHRKISTYLNSIASVIVV